MKKAMLLAIAALCVSAAQAVTYSWFTGATIDASTNTSFGPNSGSTLTDGTTSNASTNIPSGYTLVASIVLPETTVSTITGLIKVSQWGSGNTWLSVNTDGSLTVSSNLAGGSYTASTTSGTSLLGTTVDFAATYSFSETTNSEGTAIQVVTINYYINGDKVGETLAGNTTMENAQWVSSWTDGIIGDTTGISGSTTDGLATSYTVAVYDRVLDTSDIAFMAENHTTLVPEPTVLALLALGVAGIALKRRA